MPRILALSKRLGRQRAAAAVGTARVYLVTPGGVEAHGGMGRIARYLAREWAAMNYRPELRIVDTYGPGPFMLMPLYFIRAVVQIVVGWAQRDIDVLHVNMAERGSVLRKGIIVHLGKLLRVPVALHLHGANFVEFAEALPAILRGWLERMMNRADAVIVLGTFWRNSIIEKLRVDPARVIVLPNGVPGPDRVRERVADKRCRVLCLGEVSERKGTPDLLAALAGPGLEGFDWELVVAGDGEVAAARDLAASLGIARHITFVGWVDEKRVTELLASADIVALPSRNEGLPLAVLEGMAYGLAIVTTPVGAIPDAITNELTGLLVPPGDVVALRGALRRLFEDLELRGRLGSAARQRFLTVFSMQPFVQRVKNLYGRLVFGPSPPTANVVADTSERLAACERLAQEE